MYIKNSARRVVPLAAFVIVGLQVTCGADVYGGTNDVYGDRGR